MKKTDIRADLQRLADGELRQEQRTQILRAMPVDSGHWRELALAFVERQILDESLMGTEHIGETPSGGAGERPTLRLNIQPVTNFTNGRSRQDRSARGSARALWIAAIGASLMIGIALGNWQSRSTSNATGPVAVIPKAQVSPHPANDVQNPSGMPLAEALSRTTYPIPVDLRREMMKRGYLITELDQLSKVQLPTGQLVELPVRQVAVTYLGNETYQ